MTIGEQCCALALLCAALSCVVHRCKHATEWNEEVLGKSLHAATNLFVFIAPHLITSMASRLT